MTKRTLGGVVLCASLIATASLQAHHSLAGAYALKKESKITGTFKAFRLVNPHSNVKIDVKNQDGTTTEWSITGGSVTQSRPLYRPASSVAKNMAIPPPRSSRPMRAARWR